MAEVWQATHLSFLSHSTAAKKPKYRDMFSQFACSLEHNISGAAKVDFSPESCILLRKHETLHKCSLVPTDH